MQIDWTIIVAVLVIVVAIGYLVMKRKKKTS
jgi:LPXTG-motif cell wall-anchored protein